MKLNIFTTSIILLILLISCENETEFEMPVVFTGEVTNADQTKAVLNARIYNPENIPVNESGFIWGVHSGDENDLKILNTSPDNIYSLQTNYDLLPGKTYYARAFLKTDYNTIYGREVSFNTESAPVNLGKWTKIIDDPYSTSDYIKSGFLYKDNSYFILEDGEIYRLNLLDNKIDFLTSNQDIIFSSFACEFNGNAYIFVQNVLYLLNLNTYDFTKLKEWNAEKRYGCTGFLLDDNIYIGLGSSFSFGYSKEMWKYNITSDIWTKLEDFPGAFRMDAFSFCINGIGYVGGGFNLMDNQWPYPKFTDLWSYNPKTNKWQQKENLPIYMRDDLNLPGTSALNNGYCVYKNALWEYNPIFNLWEEMKFLSETSEFMNPYLFSYKNKVFLIESKSDYSEVFNGFKLYMYEK
jgi:hypothetical protein